jgi:hypothetical protein
MTSHLNLIVAIAATAFATGVSAQSATTSVGRAASAAVTPGDQNMGRTPENRSGGLVGNDTAARGAANSVGRAASAAVTPGDQNMGRTPENRSGGIMGNDRATNGSATTTTDGRRAPRADRN